MDFSNRLKGTITQTLIKALFEDAQYRVIPLGVEETIREVVVLPEHEYIQLNIPSTLRKMPDFYVSDKEMKKCWLIEVKYRKEWNEKTILSLFQKLSEQVQIWSPIYLMLFLDKPARGNGNQPSELMGILKLSYSDGKMLINDKDLEWEKLSWSHFSRVQNIFTNISERWEENTLTKVTKILSSLSGLDIYE